MHSPKTPLTSRCGYLRGRKRINPHPISVLQKRPKIEDKVDAEDSKCSSEPDISTNSESPLTAEDSGIDVSQEIDQKKARYARRNQKQNPF
ncbi:uncharacterized protein LOC128251731 [Drosophila gunungcola]|uniref:Uncharacterized protein n=1 Tax=Drosophila gunungcola TaxID=103775 RepID=A0A9P9Z0C4_9MUSC|nr:uncharacterized protein LOC128251731 [Drosophila gunungcola]KAI8045989.1 hypothetical protein M5D96_002189 [Drosophila gunungcola]